MAVAVPLAALVSTMLQCRSSMPGLLSPLPLQTWIFQCFIWPELPNPVQHTHTYTPVSVQSKMWNFLGLLITVLTGKQGNNESKTMRVKTTSVIRNHSGLPLRLSQTGSRVLPTTCWLLLYFHFIRALWMDFPPLSKGRCRFARTRSLHPSVGWWPDTFMF